MDLDGLEPVEEPGTWVTSRFSKYAAFFGREPDFAREPQPGVTPSVSVARFPRTQVGVFRRFFTPLHDRVVYITHGMSEAEMQIPQQETSVYPSRIELIAHSLGAYVGTEDGDDMLSALLQWLAVMPFSTGGFLGPMHTVSLEQAICPGCDMSAFFLAVPEGVDMPRLCRCTPQAHLVVSVMPITARERAYAVRHGSESLLDLFERHGVPNVFDLSRKPVV